MNEEDIRPQATPAQIRARLAAHRALVEANGLSGPRMAMPSACAFEAHDVLRCAMTQTDAARTFLIASNQQGRLFPLALGEVFGLIDPSLAIEIDVSPRAQMAAIDGDDGFILIITIRLGDVTRHVFHLNAIHLHAMHVHPDTRAPIFHALNTARELGRVYQSLYPTHPEE